MGKTLEGQYGEEEGFSAQTVMKHIVLSQNYSLIKPCVNIKLNLGQEILFFLGNEGTVGEQSGSVLKQPDGMVDERSAIW